jgi:hypothetical protein
LHCQTKFALPCLRFVPRLLSYKIRHFPAPLCPHICKLDFGLWPKCTRLCIQHKNAILGFFHVAKNGDGQKNHAKRM